jgi:hypothetical protein
MLCVLDWFEKHAGLGGWVGAIVAIFVTWGLARAESLANIPKRFDCHYLGNDNRPRQSSQPVTRGSFCGHGS